jgi:hypothetical protein
MSELMTKWVAALRSGKYEQGTNVLRSEWGSYCCLGVLCDVHEPRGLVTAVVRDEADRVVMHEGSYEGHDALPPQNVMEGPLQMPTSHEERVERSEDGHILGTCGRRAQSVLRTPAARAVDPRLHDFDGHVAERSRADAFEVPLQRDCVRVEREPYASS